MRQRFLSLPCSLACCCQEGSMIGHPLLRTGGAIGGQTAAQKRNPLHQIPFFDFYPATIDPSERLLLRETLLGRERSYLFCPLFEGGVVSDERKNPSADIQTCGQRWLMGQSPRLGDRGAASC